MSFLTFLICYHAKIWPWCVQNQDGNDYRCHLVHKKFKLELRLYDSRLEIESLYIIPRYRNKKLATRIIRALKEFARRNEITLQANYVLETSVDFWEKMEFTLKGYHATWSK